MIYTTFNLFTHCSLFYYTLTVMIHQVLLSVHNGYKKFYTPLKLRGYKRALAKIVSLHVLLLSRL